MKHRLPILRAGLFLCIFFVGLGSTKIQAGTFVDLTYSLTTVPAGTTVTVTWNTDCPPGELFNIQLISQVPFAIQLQFSNVPNTGSYNFTIPGTMSPGEYEFGISNSAVTVWDYGDHFDITSSPASVDWKSFDLAQKNSDILLEWSTANEINNQGFHVQHALDGRNWEDLDFVTAKGTSFDVSEYAYAHKNVATGMHYYRIKQVDQNGSFSFSPIRTLRSDEAIEISFYPNPAKDVLRIRGLKGQSPFFILDVHGRIVQEGILDADQINISTLIDGAYILQIDHSGTRIQKQFYKRN